MGRSEAEWIELRSCMVGATLDEDLELCQNPFEGSRTVRGWPERRRNECAYMEGGLRRAMAYVKIEDKKKIPSS